MLAKKKTAQINVVHTNNSKVYAPRPPPEWKTVWDHEKHFEMHYGEGMKNEALRQARQTAQAEGAFAYRSKLGKGFTFSTDNPSDNINPYSKAVQGPPTVVFEYEQGYQDAQSGKESMKRRERIVEDLHGRREARHVLQTETLRRQQQRYYKNSAFTKRTDNECVIL